VNKLQCSISLSDGKAGDRVRERRGKTTCCNVFKSKTSQIYATTLTEMSSGGYSNNSLWGSFWRTVLCL